MLPIIRSFSPFIILLVNTPLFRSVENIEDSFDPGYLSVSYIHFRGDKTGREPLQTFQGSQNTARGTKHIVQGSHNRRASLQIMQGSRNPFFLYPYAHSLLPSSSPILVVNANTVPYYPCPSLMNARSSSLAFLLSLTPLYAQSLAFLCHLSPSSPPLPLRTKTRPDTFSSVFLKMREWPEECEKCLGNLDVLFRRGLKKGS